MVFTQQAGYENYQQQLAVKCSEVEVLICMNWKYSRKVQVITITETPQNWPVLKGYSGVSLIHVL